MATKKRNTQNDSPHTKYSTRELEDELGARVMKARGILWLLAHADSFSDEVPCDTSHCAAWAAADLLREAEELVQHICNAAKQEAVVNGAKIIEVAHA